MLGKGRDVEGFSIGFEVVQALQHPILVYLSQVLRLVYQSFAGGEALEVWHQPAQLRLHGLLRVVVHVTALVVPLVQADPCVPTRLLGNIQ